MVRGPDVCVKHSRASSNTCEDLLGGARAGSWGSTVLRSAFSAQLRPNHEKDSGLQGQRMGPAPIELVKCVRSSHLVNLYVRARPIGSTETY